MSRYVLLFKSSGIKHPYGSQELVGVANHLSAYHWDQSLSSCQALKMKVGLLKTN